MVQADSRLSTSRRTFLAAAGAVVAVPATAVPVPTWPADLDGKYDLLILSIHRRDSLNEIFVMPAEDPDFVTLCASIKRLEDEIDDIESDRDDGEV